MVGCGLFGSLSLIKYCFNLLGMGREEVKAAVSKKWDNVFIHVHEQHLLKEGLPRIYPSFKVIFVCNAPTSRPMVVLRYLTFFDEAIQNSKLQRFVICGACPAPWFSQFGRERGVDGNSWS